MSQRLILFLSMIGLALPGCGRGGKFTPPPPPEVTVAYPVEKEVVETIEFTGTTRATARVDLRAQVGGILEKIGFEDGATVNEGDLLFVIEQAPYQAKLQLAQAGLERAEATLKKAELAIARARKLFEQNAAPESDVESATAQRDTAAADVSAAKADLRNAQLQLGYTEIRAPITGRISRHLLDRGNLVQAQMTELATIESITPIHAFFYVSERELLRLMELRRANAIPDPEKVAPELFLGLASEKGYPRKGYLDYREFGVDPGTGTVLRRGSFPNDDMALIPGLFVRIQAPLGKPKPQLLIEERAVGTDQRGEYLLTVDDKNIVQYRLVELGPAIDGMRIVRSGVSAGDRIIVNGLQRARPGGTVTPKDPAKESTVGGAGGGNSGGPVTTPAPEQSAKPAPPPGPDGKPAKAGDTSPTEAASPSAENNPRAASPAARDERGPAPAAPALPAAAGTEPAPSTGEGEKKG